MTEQMAIQQLNFDMEMIRFDPYTGETLTLEQIKARNEDNYKTYIADEMAITALLEIQQIKETIKDFALDCGGTVADVKEMYRQLNEYLKIGTAEELQALKEKSVAKEPKGNDGCTCPNCNTFNEVFMKRKNTVGKDIVNCWHCGQAVLLD